MITDVPGVLVGHWSDPVGRTGCTVVLFPQHTVASGEIRGGAPGTRERALLDPLRTVASVDAVVLCGGSAFGLAACDGVVQWCAEHGRGLPVPGGRVPIVVGVVLYDLGVGDGDARPGPDAGYAACTVAGNGRVETGAVGAGAGATVGKWRGPGVARPGGIGTVSVRQGDLVVGVLLAVNAFGERYRPDTAVPQWPMATAPAWARDSGVGTAARAEAQAEAGMATSTTIGVVVTNARLDKAGCLLVAQSAHDGLARALEPVHTIFDGDAVVAAAVGQTDAPLEQVRLCAARAVTDAVGATLPD